MDTGNFPIGIFYRRFPSLKLLTCQSGDVACMHVYTKKRGNKKKVAIPCPSQDVEVTPVRRVSAGVAVPRAHVRSCPFQDLRRRQQGVGRGRGIETELGGGGGSTAACLRSSGTHVIPFDETEHCHCRSLLLHQYFMRASGRTSSASWAADQTLFLGLRLGKVFVVCL